METTATIPQLYEVSYHVAHEYFSDILNAQVVIFSVIVAVVVGFQFWLSYRISEKQIEDEVEKKVKQAEKRLSKEYINRVNMLVEIAATSEKKLNKKTNALQADIYRTMGHFFDSEKKFSVAFIWWVRASENYSLTEEESLTRIALRLAKESVERVNNSYEIQDDMGEYQKVLLALDDRFYRLEKELLDVVVKKVLTKN